MAQEKGQIFKIATSRYEGTYIQHILRNICSITYLITYLVKNSTKYLDK